MVNICQRQNLIKFVNYNFLLKMILFFINIEYKCRKISQFYENYEILYWNKFIVKFWLNVIMICVFVSDKCIELL